MHWGGGVPSSPPYQQEWGAKVRLRVCPSPSPVMRGRYKVTLQQQVNRKVSFIS